MMKRFTTWLAATGMVLLASGAQAEYKRELLVTGSDFHGVHGITANSDGTLFVGSVVGGAIYRVDPASGSVTTEIKTPTGMADDLEFGPDGTLAYTSFLSGIVRARRPDGKIDELASGLPGINSIAWKQDGRLFATQVFLGDALYEIDPAGAKPARKIIEGMGGLNGFDFGPDGMLYGPLWFKGQVVKVNVDTGELNVVADGFKIPAAANFDSNGNLYVVDTARGQVVRVDISNGDKTVIASVPKSIDNLAFDANDTLYITNMADNGVYRIDTSTGAATMLTEGELAMPGGLDVWNEGGKDTIYVADLFAYRGVNADNGKVTDFLRMHADTLEYPFNVRVNKDHAVLSSWFTGTVQKVDRKTGKNIAIWHNFAAPHDAIELPDGTVVVAELGAGQLTLARGEKPEERTAIAKGLAGPLGLAIAGKNAVYVTELSGVLSRVDLNTGNKTVIAEGLALPEGIDVDEKGIIYLAEVALKQVVKIDPATGEKTVIASNLPIGLPGIEGIPPSNVPTGIAVGKDGVVYVTSDLENAIYKLTPQ
ncbi:MAG: PQQ-binding-like beta-propeller repeat protein [Sneathiellales bacterium]|nr:PQQ-binding-like beta-propeller repeat protein [Sneathiellales bacterium]